MKFALINLILLYSIVACKTPSKQNVAKSNLSVSLNQTFSIELKSNPSTGYVWALKDSSLITKLKPVGSKFISPKQASGMVGVGSIQQMSFKATKKGVQILEFIYIRPWEKGAQPAQTRSYKVQIK